MEKKIDLSPKFLHHAYLVIGQKESFRQFLDKFLKEELGINIKSNPDIRFFSETNFSIDEVRNIKEGEEFKNFGGKVKIFVIEANFITIEAQNALLKIFEEPSKGSHFFLNLSQDIILPTLRSRVYAIDLTESIGGSVFLEKTLEEKMTEVKEIVEGISKDNLTKQDAIYFVNKIESEIYKEGVYKNYKKLIACQNARNYLYDRGAPIKMILESLVLVV